MCPTRCCTPTITFRLTWDEEEGRLKAVDLHDAKRAVIDALFLSELGAACSAWDRDRAHRGQPQFRDRTVKGKEIFSKRRNEILKEGLATEIGSRR
jgi:hypothetical protein